MTSGNRSTEESKGNQREGAPAPRPAGTPPVPAPLPESSAPGMEKKDSATIGKAVRIVGQIHTKEDLYVDGQVEGTIESAESRVVIGPNGRVQAGIKAREVVIFGHVQGNVVARDKVDIRKDAKLLGDITTSRIGIEDGALLRGNIDIK